MDHKKSGAEAFRVIRWCPGLQGFRRWIDLRTMTRDGQVWFAAQDVQKALGITRRACHDRRYDRLEGNSLGTIRAQWQGRDQQLLFISLTALTVVMAGRHDRLDRFFLRWLDSLEDVVSPVDAECFMGDVPRPAQHSTGAYLQHAVDHATA